MEPNYSKQKIIDAASLLFFRKGFRGTTIRDIAFEASVNISSISYYFKNKQGLLEYAVTHYYEAYLKSIEKALSQRHLSHIDMLKKVVYTVIDYKQGHYQMSCFIHRELSLDSVFVREMAVTYIAKENYYISDTLYRAIDNNSGNKAGQHYFFLQLKGMLAAPYFSHNEWEYELVTVHPRHYFVKKYVEAIYKWIDFLTITEHISLKTDT